MTEAELHEREWIEERAGRMQAEGMEAELAGKVALEMWRAYQDGRKRAQEGAQGANGGGGRQGY